MSCASRRMETASPDGPADLETFRRRSGRPICLSRDLSLPVVLLPDQGNTRHGRTGTQLAAGPSMRFPQWAFLHRRCARSGRTRRNRSCLWMAQSDLVPRTNAPRDSPSLVDSSVEGSVETQRRGTCFQTSRNFISGPWMGSRGSRWPTPRGSRHHHFGVSTVYETRLRLEVEHVHRVVFFSPRRPSEMPDQSRAVIFAAGVGAKGTRITYVTKTFYIVAVWILASINR